MRHGVTGHRCRPTFDRVRHERGAIGMTRARIFLSHASADAELTDEVAAHFPDDDSEFELLLDKRRLEAGWTWESYLHEWMARCDAGLLLLTPTALERDYVLKEATILAWRMSLDPGFRFYVARDPAIVGNAMLAKYRFTPVNLDRVQSITTLDPGTIATTVRNGLARHVLPESPFDKLVNQLADLLDGTGSQAIADVAERLGVIEEWRPAAEQRIRHVQVIARALFCGKLGEYGHQAGVHAPTPQGLHALIGDLVDTTPVENLKTILAKLAPHWVDGDAAGKCALLPRHQPRRALGMNGKYVPTYTAQLMITRGHLDKASNYHVLPVGGANAGGFVDHYTAEICAAYAQTGMDWLDGDELMDVINEDTTRYVVLPPPAPEPAELGTLLDRFPGVNFVLWTGEYLEQLDDGGRVDWADPPIDPAVERRMRADFAFARRTIRDKEAG